MHLIVSTAGKLLGLYDEPFDWAALGPVNLRRASHVEPDGAGKWWADLAPVHGPRLGPFRLRSRALEAERAWIEARLTELLATR
jgi:hypothetical protein